jgi:hypothetical protein
VIKIRFFDMQENVRSAPLLSFSAIDFSEYPRNGGRLWIRSSILIFLAVYLIIVQKPLRAIQYEVLGTLY